MISALFSFLGGSAFRMIWGEISAYLTARENHKQEIDKLRLQEEIDAAAHARNLESLKLQSDLGIKTIEVQRDSDLSKIESSAWADIVASTGKSTGIKWLDTWNGSVRPLLATMAIVAVVVEIASHGFILTEWDRELFGAILGIYIADRSLTKRGK